MKALLFVIAALALAGCMSQASVPASLGKPFVLKYNQAADFGSEGLLLRFVDVPADSRCPSDVVCVWAGEATVTVQAAKGGELSVANLTLGAGSASDTWEFRNYTIKLLKVEPYPVSTQPIGKSEYVATLQVD